MTHSNINSHCHINGKDLHLNSYGEKQLTRNFINFKEVLSNEVKKILKNLDKKKSAISSCIPVSILIDSTEITSHRYYQ